MRASKMGAVLVLVLVNGGLALAGDKARPRDSGSSTRSSSVGETHHSSGSTGPRSSSDTSRSVGSSSTGSSASAPLTEAQRHHPRAGTGRGYRFGRFSYGYRWPYYGYYYDPFRYNWYDSYWYYGYSPWYSGGYGYGPYGYAGRRYSYRDGSVRVLVEPSKTQVYVDGYYAGIADDFDGLFQRLNLPTGRHEITLKLDGYRTHKIRLYVPLDHTIKIHYDMVRGSGEDTAEDQIGPAAPPPGAERYGTQRYGDEGRDLRDDEDADQVLDEDAAPDRGTLRLEVTPRDASIYVNGEFRGTGRLESLSLPAGRYHVEIVRPGYRVLERDVEIQVGHITRMVAELDRRS